MKGKKIVLLRLELIEMKSLVQTKRDCPKLIFQRYTIMEIMAISFLSLACMPGDSFYCPFSTITVQTYLLLLKKKENSPNIW
jgi:hypothetical protein